MVLRLYTSSSNNWKIKAVVIALIGIFFVEALLGMFAPESDMCMYFDVVRRLVTQKKDVVVQVMGDSVSRTGIWAGILEAELKAGEIENYSLQGSGPIFSYFLLRDQIEAGAAPKYVVYAHSPHTYSGVRFPILVGTFATCAETIELMTAGADPYEVLFGVLNRISYTLRYRDQFDKATRGDFSFFTEPRDILIGEELYQHELAHVTRLDPTRDLPDRYVEPFAVSDLNRDFLNRFIDLAETNDITILWVTMPLPPSVYDARRADGFMDAYYAFVDSIQSDYVVMLQPEFTVLDYKYFRDHSHLNAEGGVEFTKQLAGKLAPIVNAAGHGSSERASVSKPAASPVY